MKPSIIGIAGGTSSGKFTICQILMDRLKKRPEPFSKSICIIRMESFYRELTTAELELAQNHNFNFDHPNAFDFDLIDKTLHQLLLGKSVLIPDYDPIKYTRKPGGLTIEPTDVILFEGILALYDIKVRDSFSMKLFVDEDSDLRLSRRVVRDVLELGRSFDTTVQQYIKFVKPSFDDYILPTKKYADVIVPRGEENQIALELIEEHIVELVGDSDLRHRQSSSSLPDKKSPQETILEDSYRPIPE